MIFISIWQKNVIVLGSVRESFTSAHCRAKQLPRIAQGLQIPGEAALPMGHHGSASLGPSGESLRASWCPGHLFLNETSASVLWEYRIGLKLQRIRKNTQVNQISCLGERGVCDKMQLDECPRNISQR